MKVILAQPRGFCAGVVRAIEIVERALERYGPPIYVRHEIVHNKYVVETLKAKGVRFVEELEDVPSDAHAIFSAHGVSKDVEREAVARGLRVIDATCPLVTKVHNHGRRYAGQGRTIILIGHAGHPEVEGTMGQISGPGAAGAVGKGRRGARHRGRSSGRLRHPDDAERRRHQGHHPGPASTVHQYRRAGNAGHLLCHPEPADRGARAVQARRRDSLVVGAKNSSNSNRLREIGEEAQKAELSGGGRQRTAGRVVRRGRRSSASPPAPRRRKCWWRT